MLKKIIISLFILFLSESILLSNNFSNANKKINFGFHYRSFWADRYFTGSPLTEKNTTKVEKAFGFSVENIRFDYGAYYEGTRSTLNWDFGYNKVFNPYLGISNIQETGLKSKYKQKEQELDGYDMVLGVSFNIAKIFRPYVEYTIYNNLFYFGFNLHIPITITRPYKITFGF